ncbi:wings apart-like protein regulation of heterochromatin-domain-containing protein [Rhexocercosporidium sp. MPI-PUGE-AT-0058]|nr:wings apart-like protein regulation of heterochromatin-domain-containing protein [Rhexocercosporidium sp. MPI-PUGE-AT-0058]
MATFQDGGVSRKKLTTYGKATRKRIPEYHGFASMARKSQTPDLQSKIERPALTSIAPAPPSSTRPTTPSKLKSVRERSASRTPSTKSGDIFDVPESDGESSPPKSVQKKVTPTKPKVARPRSVSRGPVSKPPASIFDMPESDDDAPVPKPAARKPVRKLASPPAKSKPILRRSVSRTPAPPSPVKDIFDIPSDDKVPVRKLARTPIVKQPKMLAVVQQPMSISSSPATTPKHVFDVPSSDDEAVPTPKPVQKLVKKMVVNGVSQVNHKPPTSGLDDTASRKKLKLSPNEPSLKRLPVDNPRAASRPRVKNIRGRNTSPKTGHFAKMVARPKVKEPPQRKPEPPRAPEKLSISPEPEASTPSTNLSDVDVMDLDPNGRHISHKGKQMWQALLENEEASEENTTESDERDVFEAVEAKSSRSRAPASAPRLRSPLSRPSGVMKPPQKASRTLPRRRLIDSLVEQAADSSEEESEDEDSAESTHSADLDIVMEDAPPSQNVLQPPLISESQSSQTTGPKFTYAKQRSMLNEDDLMSQLAMELPTVPPQNSQGRRGRRASIPTLKPLASFHDEVGDEDDSVAAIRSVHELRQAGANNRFLDEVQDFLDRIGSPGKTTPSMRRSGLLDLAHKMQDKNFSRQFRSNGMEQRLFLHLGQETEIVSGFLMVTILVSLLMEGNMPHIVSQLRRQGITRLLIRLLESQSGINLVVKDRKSNMSKVAQSLVSDYQDYLLQLPVWEDLKPLTISPRTIALKCLELMVRQTREAGNAADIFSKELTTNLFAIVKSATDDRSWALPKEKSAIDFYLALSALESHSITARTIQDETIWINEYLPIIRDTLQIALTRPLEEFGVLQILLLRLTLNVTNNNPRASDVFARAPLMSAMGQVMVTRFNQISRFMLEEDLSVAVDHLILVLGVVINFAEWSPACRESLQTLEGGSSDPLDGMVQAFADSLERSSQADSVQESQKNVAFGYLSVLLGYLSLLPTLSERIQAKQPRKTLRPIVASIEEFIGHHKTVDMIAADEEGHSPQTGLTERLEALVAKLKVVKVGKK